MACKVKVNRHGYLAFRFYWNGREFWQGTGWKDTPKNRLKAEGKAVEMTEQINADTFDYLRWFPKAIRRTSSGQRPQASAPAAPLTVRKFYEEWIEKKRPPFVRIGLQRNYKQDFKRYILPFMGDVELNSIAVDAWRAFAFIWLTNEAWP